MYNSVEFFLPNDQRNQWRNYSYETGKTKNATHQFSANAPNFQPTHQISSQRTNFQPTHQFSANAPIFSQRTNLTGRSNSARFFFSLFFSLFFSHFFHFYFQIEMTVDLTDWQFNIFFRILRRIVDQKNFFVFFSNFFYFVHIYITWLGMLPN